MHWSNLITWIVVLHVFAWVIYELLGTGKANREVEEFERRYQENRRKERGE